MSRQINLSNNHFIIRQKKCRHNRTHAVNCEKESTSKPKIQWNIWIVWKRSQNFGFWVVITITIKLAINVLNMAIPIVSIIYFSTMSSIYIKLLCRIQYTRVAQRVFSRLVCVFLVCVCVLFGCRNAIHKPEELRVILHNSSCVFCTSSNAMNWHAVAHLRHISTTYTHAGMTETHLFVIFGIRLMIFVSQTLLLFSTRFFVVVYFKFRRVSVRKSKTHYTRQHTALSAHPLINTHTFTALSAFGRFVSQTLNANILTIKME